MTPLSLLLADDDTDDCFLFKEALNELPLSTKLTTVNNGEQLMNLLSAKGTSQFDVLFLDLNMPRKSGFECLTEIRASDQLLTLPVIIYSTSLNMDTVDQLYQKGARYYVCKPGEYGKLKMVISEALTRIMQNPMTQPEKDKFIIQV